MLTVLEVPQGRVILGETGPRVEFQPTSRLAGSIGNTRNRKTIESKSCVHKDQINLKAPALRVGRPARSVQKQLVHEPREQKQKAPSVEDVLEIQL